jgi:hypothetical protein
MLAHRHKERHLAAHNLITASAAFGDGAASPVLNKKQQPGETTTPLAVK